MLRRVRQPSALVLLLCGLVWPYCAVMAQDADAEAAAAATIDPAFDRFWQSFREAVTLDDREAVRAMTRFPIRLDGKDYDGQGFVDRFDWLFTGAEKECFASEVPARDGEGYQLLCGEMIFVFRNEGEGYQFTDIGVND